MHSSVDDMQWSPYVGVIDLQEGLMPASGCVPRERGGTEGIVGYRVPFRGQLQVVIKNPNRTAIKVFLVPYDYANMPPNTKTFLRQKVYAVSSTCSSSIIDNGIGIQSPSKTKPLSTTRHLRYAVHLQFICTPKKRIYLYKSIRVVFSPRSIDSDEKLETTTDAPGTSLYHPVSSDIIPITTMNRQPRGSAQASLEVATTRLDNRPPCPKLLSQLSPVELQSSSPILIPSICYHNRALTLTLSLLSQHVDVTLQSRSPLAHSTILANQSTLSSPSTHSLPETESLLTSSLIDISNCHTTTSSSSLSICDEIATPPVSIISSLNSWHILSSLNTGLSFTSSPHHTSSNYDTHSSSPYPLKDTPLLSANRSVPWPRSCLVDEKLLDPATGGTGLTGDFERDIDIFWRACSVQSSSVIVDSTCDVIQPVSLPLHSGVLPCTLDNHQPTIVTTKTTASLLQSSSSRSCSPTTTISLLTEQLEQLDMTNSR